MSIQEYLYFLVSNKIFLRNYLYKKQLVQYEMINNRNRKFYKVN